MKLKDLVATLQDYAHMGHADDEVYFDSLTNVRGTRQNEPYSPMVVGHTSCNKEIHIELKDSRCVDNYAYPED